MNPMLDQQRRTLSYLRLPRAARRRRARPVVAALRRLALMSALATAVIVAAAWLLTAQRLQLERIEVVGGQRVEQSWVEARLGPWRGRNLLLLDLENIERVLLQHPWARAVHLRKSLPDGLVVVIEESSPVAVLVADARQTLIDEAGRPIGVVAPEDWPELLRLSSAESTSSPNWPAAVRMSNSLQGSGSVWAKSPRRVEALSGNDFRIEFDNTDFVLVVDSATAQRRVGDLDRLLPGLRQRFPEVEQIDLRFEQRVVIRPRRGDGSSREG